MAPLRLPRMIALVAVVDESSLDLPSCIAILPHCQADSPVGNAGRCPFRAVSVPPVRAAHTCSVVLSADLDASGPRPVAATNGRPAACTVRWYGKPWFSVHLICQVSPPFRFQTEADLITRDVRFGSFADIRRCGRERPLQHQEQKSAQTTEQPPSDPC